MAMNKTEQKRMDDLEHALRLARALRWPDYPEPAPMTEAEIRANLAPGGKKQFGNGDPEKVCRGWFVNSYQTGRVSHGCSNGFNHSDSGDYTTTQNMGVMYPTELDAWRLLRCKKTREYAEHLAKIDAEIARLVE